MNSRVAKKRDGSLDLTRIVGVVAVVAGHIWLERWMALLVYPWHVPLFFIISGYLWTNGRRTLAQETVSRARSLLLPYASWMLATAPFYILLESKMDIDKMIGKSFDLLLGGSHVGLPYSAFWFITALFFACIFYRSLDKVPFTLKGFILFLLLSIAYFFEDQVSAVPLSAGVGICSTFFLWAGEAMRKMETHVRNLLAWGAGSLALSLGLGILLHTPLNMKYGYFGQPILSVLMAIACFAALLYFSRLISSTFSAKTTSFVSEIASVSLGTVLGHGFVIWLAVAALDTHDPRLLFPLALLIPWIFSYLSRGSSWSPFMLGTPRARKLIS